MKEIENIYLTYKQDVFLYLVNLTHNPQLSEDLLSETFLGAIKSLPRFQGDSDIKTWLFSIARYKWYEQIRKEKRTISFDELLSHYLTEELECSILKKETVKRIISLLDKEEPRAKDIVIMRIDGYSYYEVARKHGISEGSARVIDFRTKKRIKEVLIKEEWHHE